MSTDRHPPAVENQGITDQPSAGSAEAYYAAFLAQASENRQSVADQPNAFVRQIHSSLNPTEVSYLVANDGRRLVGCDRLSVGLRRGKHVTVEAVSGADVIESRSNVVQRMRELFDAVLQWGEPVAYMGVRDESVPASVLLALDGYLAICPSRFLMVLPIRDGRESETKEPLRSALLLECFNAAHEWEALRFRFEAIGAHAASALYNALEHDDIPMRWVWRHLGRIRRIVGGSARVKWVVAAVIATCVVTSLIVVPYPYRVEARGKLLPEVRRWVYSPIEGQVIHFEEAVQPGGVVHANQSLALMYDVQLEVRMIQLANDIAGAQQSVDALAHQEMQATTEAERLRLSAEKKQKEFVRDRKTLERRALRDRVHADETRPGYFWIKSPLTGTVLNSDFRETSTNRHVKASEPLLRIGDKTQPWEIEVEIPQQYVADILRSFEGCDGDAELIVDLQLKALPARNFQGKLVANRVTSHANSNREFGGDSVPTVRASVRIDGSDIEESVRVPSDVLVAGTEVRAKVNCGRRPLGAVLFHGVWNAFHRLVF